jgi:uncharacterized protein (DUF488 family)
MTESRHHAIYTIGHSNHPFARFLEILKSHQIAILADVRSLPRSRYNAQFNKSALEESLPRHLIAYHHLPGLGGFRQAPKTSKPPMHEDPFAGYRHYMGTDAFSDRLRQLIDLSAQGATVLMCAEADPARCHRFLISDALEARGIAAIHILAIDHVQKHADYAGRAGEKAARGRVEQLTFDLGE